MRNLVDAVALAGLVLLAVFVWPTRCKYDSLKLRERTLTHRCYPKT